MAPTRPTAPPWERQDRLARCRSQVQRLRQVFLQYLLDLEYPAFRRYPGEWEAAAARRGILRSVAVREAESDILHGNLPTALRALFRGRLRAAPGTLLSRFRLAHLPPPPAPAPPAASGIPSPQ